MSWRSFHGNRLIERTERVLSEGVMEATEAIGMISDQQVPHDEGILQGSKVIKANPRDRMEVAISYGGGSGTGHPVVPYAVRWHENDANFQKGRKRDYLRDPVFQQGGSILRQKLTEKARRVW